MASRIQHSDLQAQAWTWVLELVARELDGGTCSTVNSSGLCIRIRV